MTQCIQTLQHSAVSSHKSVCFLITAFFRLYIILQAVLFKSTELLVAPVHAACACKYAAAEGDVVNAMAMCCGCVARRELAHKRSSER